MARFAKYRNDQFVGIAVHKIRPDNLPAKGVKWYPVDFTATRADAVAAHPGGFDKAAHVVSRTEALVGDKYVLSWPIRDKTQAELDADAARAVAEKKVNWKDQNHRAHFAAFKAMGGWTTPPTVFADNKAQRAAFKVWWEAL